MSFFDILLLALALAVDATVVSFSYGLIIKRKRSRSAFKLATANGLGQFIMPIFGWLATCSVSEYIQAYDHWISFLIFLCLGLNVLNEAWSEKNSEKLNKKLNLKTLAMIALATSIDAGAAGVSIYFSKAPILFTSFIIGVVAFIGSYYGFKSCSLLKKVPTKYIETASGMILISLGIKILVEHIFIS